MYMLSVCSWEFTMSVADYTEANSIIGGWWTGKDVGVSSHGLFWGTALECLEELKKTTKDKHPPG
jgi:hypothetical protein